MPVKKVKKIEETENSPKFSFKGKFFYASGKRKTAIARIKLYKGEGNIIINNKPINEYVTVKSLIGSIKSPFKLTGTDKKYDVFAIVIRGGINAQAEAIRHGITKALIEADPLTKPSLKKAGFLTRDSRIKERKKYGLKRARRGPQFSKR